MLKKIIKTITIFLIIVLVVTLNEKMLPQRREITDIAIVKVIGLDVQEQAILTAVTVNTGQSQNDTNQASSGGSGETNSAIVSKGDSFKIAEKIGQSYTDKSIDAGHVSYFFIGENTAKNNFSEAVSYIATNEEVRLSTQIYIIKDHSAEEFIKKVINNKYDISEKIGNIEENDRQLGESSKIRLADIIKMMESEESRGVVPVLELKVEEIKDRQESMVNNYSEEDTETENFNLGGYAIFKENKMIDYLSLDESIGYNFLKNDLQSTSITAQNLSGEKLEIGLTKAKTGFEFEFDENKIKKIKINVKASGNLEEADLIDKYFTPDERVNLEKQINETITNQIQGTIDKAKKLDTDFLNIEEDVLNKKHPYKYSKIKKNIKNIWNEAEISINVEARIERNYDVFKSADQG